VARLRRAVAGASLVGSSDREPGMGIYDREYIRDDSGMSRWFTAIPPACRTFLAINIAVWLVQIVAPNLKLAEFFGAASHQILREFQVWRLLTATFLHSDNIFHILWNMLFLWYFGRELESMYGTREFAIFYLAACVFSTLVWAIVDLAFHGGGAHMIGASGAVWAVTLLNVLYFPNREILLFFFLPVRMWMLAAFLLGMDALQLLSQTGGATGRGAGVAFAAHLAGAAFGWAYKASDVRFSKLWPRRRWKPRLRVVVPEWQRAPAKRAGSVARAEAGRSGPSAPSNLVPQDQLEARLDEVLAKIAREGRGGLTDEEKSILDEASRRARIRRSDKI
jgi:membrane associated rhomboid family serine protease